MEIKRYHGLCSEAMEIRKSVFVQEQHFVDEFDDIDQYALTLVGFIDGIPVACSRAFYDKNENKYKIGRFAVLKPYRHQKLGTQMLLETCVAVKEMGAKEVWLHSQLTAIGFYEKSGFISCGEIGFEENCPHLWMRKEL